MSRMSGIAGLLLLATSLARAQEPAALIPGDAFFYVEADAAAAQRGLRQLDLAKIIANPKFRDFFMPGFRRLGVDPQNPIDSLIRKLHIEEWLAGHAAVAVRGVTVSFDELDQKTATAPAPTRIGFLHEIFGASLGSLLRTGGQAGLPARVELDLVAVVDPGPRLDGWVQNFLQNPLIDLKRRAVQIGDRQLLHLTFPPMDVGHNVYYSPQFYLHLGQERWLLATNPKVLQGMLSPRRPSLATKAGFRSVRERLTGGERALFAWLDPVRALSVFRRFVPPVISEALQRYGLGSVVGAGAGLSLVEGGVRESFGLVLDGEPKGAWRLLDAFPGGMRSIEIAPPRTGAVLGFKFDLAILLQRVRELADRFPPGSAEQFELDLVKEFREELDLDLKKELLPALGDEIGLLLFKPKAIFPEWVFGLDVRDEEAFARVFPKLRRWTEVEWEPVDIRPGTKGWRMKWEVPTPAPWVVVHKGHLFVASNKELLLDVIDKWGREGARTLVKDSPSFRRTLRGLTGGRRDHLIALSYLDLRASLPLIMGTFPLTEDFEGHVDLDHMPDPTHLFSQFAGVAVGLTRDDHGITLEFYAPVPVAAFMSLAAPVLFWIR